jgi:hypothetical protein
LHGRQLESARLADQSSDELLGFAIMKNRRRLNYFARNPNVRFAQIAASTKRRRGTRVMQQDWSKDLNR